MDITLSQSRLKRYLKKMHNLDLTHRIEMVTNWNEVPMEFEHLLNYDMLRRYLNRFGPLYYLKGKRKNYLVQERNNDWYCIDTREYQKSLTEVLQDVGIPDYLITSITPEELYEIYKEEN
jgi:hypothetical protein